MNFIYNYIERIIAMMKSVHLRIIEILADFLSTIARV